jgi:excisionase family DNA binding protein
MDVPSIAEFIGVSPSIIRQLIRDNRIPHNRIGTRIIFLVDEIIAWLRDNQCPARNNVIPNQKVANNESSKVMADKIFRKAVNN